MRLRGGDEVESLDEEFLHHLSRGSDLLARGDAEGARAALERGLELRPKDVKILGLLGQAYYRLSRFDDAARVWQRLVDDNPVEASGRVNLGLAYLKAKRHPEAVKQLEIALDLNPEHKKAMGYLGLALLDSGDPTGAREWFRRAGSEAMVARCDDVIAGRSLSAAPAAREPAEPPPAPAEPESLAAQAPEGPPAPSPAAGGTLAAWSTSRLAHAAPGEVFSLAADALLVRVRGEVRIRLDGLFAAQGRVAMASEMKRFRGRSTERPFGEGATRMHRVAGDGVLFYRTRGRRFTALDLGPDAAYLREEVLFGLEETVAFENGRVPSPSAELNLVHLRGRGRFLLATVGEPVAVEVAAEAPLRVPVAALVGWIGALTPRVCTLVDEPADLAVVAVELTGDGRVLADPAAGLGREPT